jgi:hypothetical protein
MRTTDNSSSRDAKAFLKEWANFKGNDRKEVERFWLMLKKRLSPVTELGNLSAFRETEYLMWADQVREFWGEEDPSRKFYLGYGLVEWAVRHVRDRLNVQAGFYKDGETVILCGYLPQEEQHRPYPLESVFIFLLQNAKFTALCANPQCPAPCFFRVRTRQRYCDKDCVRWAIRKSQREYWNEKGKVARKARKSRSGKSSDLKAAQQKKITDKAAAPRRVPKKRRKKQ